MPRLPVDPPVRVTPHGAFGFQRKTAADGRCGYRNKYPCTHLGVDLAAKKGTPVYAPEECRVVISASDNNTPPLRGFGPGAVVLLGKSGMRHVLGHLDPDWWTSPAWQIPGSIFEGFIGPARTPSEGRVYREGEQIGVVAQDHVHWELSPMPTSYTKKAGTRYDPIAWAQGRAVVSGGRTSMLPLLLLLALSSGRRK